MGRRSQRETRTPEYGRSPQSELDQNLARAVQASAERVGVRVAAALAAITRPKDNQAVS
jgi:hypothetical protein